jgi:molybdenum cofactor synthesis domain-containing protein
VKLRAKVLTVSDGVAAGAREDRAGPALARRLAEAGYEIVESTVVSDGLDEVAGALLQLTEGFHGVVVSTGGTGMSPRDLTPEATERILERRAPGLGEAMRAASPRPHGMLSRGVCGTRGASLVLNVPGSEPGAVECIEAVLEALPHALDLLAGGRPH